MMPTFYANSVLIHLNDTGEISHEIGEAAFMSEMIKIIQGAQTASLMETWLMVWDYECSPNGIYTVCPMPSPSLCQWLLFLAAGRIIQLTRRRWAPQQSLSLCWGSSRVLGFVERCHEGLEPASVLVPTLDGVVHEGACLPPAFMQKGYEQSWVLWKCTFPEQGHAP